MGARLLRRMGFSLKVGCALGEFQNVRSWVDAPPSELGLKVKSIQSRDRGYHFVRMIAAQLAR